MFELRPRGRIWIAFAALVVAVGALAAVGFATGIAETTAIRSSDSDTGTACATNGDSAPRLYEFEAQGTFAVDLEPGVYQMTISFAPNAGITTDDWLDLKVISQSFGGTLYYAVATHGYRSTEVSMGGNLRQRPQLQENGRLERFTYVRAPHSGLHHFRLYTSDEQFTYKGKSTAVASSYRVLIRPDADVIHSTDCTKWLSVE